MTDIRIEVDAKDAVAMLGMLPVTLSRALRAAMTDATVLLQDFQYLLVVAIQFHNSAKYY